MNLEEILRKRSNNQCELSGEKENLSVYAVSPVTANEEDSHILVSEKVWAQIEKQEEPDSKFWERNLPNVMWSEIPGVQVVSWRLLNRFRTETWAADALDILYLDEEMLEWAKASNDHLGDGTVQFHRDAHGTILQTGDTISVIKDLNVKGSSLVAKIGTSVRNIRLDPNNYDQIEGRVDAQNIVLLTKFVKKVN